MFFCTHTSLFQVLNPTCCIRLATSFNTEQHRPAVLDSTMDDVGSVWPSLYVLTMTDLNANHAAWQRVYDSCNFV